MGFTDDCCTDGRVPSVSPSVLFSPTDCIAVTDGINPSVKLDNVVVNIAELCLHNYFGKFVIDCVSSFVSKECVLPLAFAIYIHLVYMVSNKPLATKILSTLNSGRSYFSVHKIANGKTPLGQPVWWSLI
jgi:hypothetical protein